MSNMDDNFGKEIDLSEHISEWLRKKAMLERRPKNGRKGSHCWSSDYTASNPPLIENRYLNQTWLADQFIHKKRN